MDKLKKLVGKEVKIWPGNYDKKRGIILEVSSAGVLFEITFYYARDGNTEYVVGKQHFIAFSAGLQFEVV